MDFADKLREKSDAAAVKFAEEFAEKVKPELVAAAEEGYRAYVESISNTNNDCNHLHLMEHPLFAEKLSDILSGVRVSVSVSGFYTKVNFDWVIGSECDMPTNE